MPDNRDNSEDDKIDNLFKGLNRFVDIISNMVETGKSLSQFSGEIGDLNKQDKIHGRYGFSVGFCDANKERVDQIRETINEQTKKNKEIIKGSKSTFDIYEEEDRIIIVMEMPGVLEENIVVSQFGRELEIVAENSFRKYSKKIQLSIEPKNTDISKSVNNGILKITIMKRPDQEE